MSSPNVSAQAFGTRGLHRWLIGACAILFWLNAWTSSRSLPAVADEVAHVTGGLFEWKYGVSHLQPENAFFMKRWATLPLRPAVVALPPVPADVPFDSAMMVVGHRTFYETGHDSAHWLGVARAMAASVGALLIIFIGGWGVKLWGGASGVLAALLAAVCPTLLANAGLVMSDVPLALGLLGAATASWWMLERPTYSRVLVSGVAMAFALLAKMSGVLVVPLLVVLAVVRVAWPKRYLDEKLDDPSSLRLVLSCVGALAIAWAIIWAAYGFHFSMFAQADAPRPLYTQTWADFTTSSSFATRSVAQLREWRVLPEHWLYGLAHTLDHLGGRQSFLNGDVKIGSWSLFFPYSLLVKTPLALFALMAIGLFASGSPYGSNADSIARVRWRAATPLIVLSLVYWAAALTSTANIGHRHLLPIYPPMLILAGGAATYWFAAKWSLRLLAIVLPILIAVESVIMRPDYLAYFNVIAGGPSQAHRHLVDSSLDVGQDLNALSRWWRERQTREGKEARLFLSFFGPADPVAHGITAVRFGDTGFDSRPRSEPAVIRGGWFVLSVTLYQGLYTLTPGKWTAEREALYQRLLPQLRERVPTHAEALTFEHLQFGRLRHCLGKREPDERVGYTLLLFRLSDADVTAALYGPLKVDGR